MLLGLATPEESTVTNATHTRKSSVRSRTPSLTVERTITAARRTQLSIDGSGAAGHRLKDKALKLSTV